jgi:membrane protein implicated in regulation of membrane protease activity
MTGSRTLSAPHRGRVFLRYALFQLPELTLGALVLSVLVELDIVSVSVGWGLFGVWIGKEIALYPLLRHAYAQEEARDAADQLLGKVGSVTARVEPGGVGMIRLGSELWRARIPSAADPVEVGGSVRVAAVTGLTLEVVAVDTASHAAP